MKFRWLLLLPSFLSVFLLSSAAYARQLLSWRFDNNQNRLVFITDAGVQPKAQLIRNPDRVVIDLPGISLGRKSANQPGKGGIREVRVGQLDDQTTRIVVELAPGFTLDPQQVKFRGISPREWTVDFPKPERAGPLSSTLPSTSIPLPIANNPPSSNPPSQQRPPSFPVSGNSQVATIQSVELGSDGKQLLIRADQRVKATSTWDTNANAYRITIPSARLADQLTGPQLDALSPLSRVQIRQQDSRTVVIFVQPSVGIQVGEINQPNDQLLALQLQSTGFSSQPPFSSSIPVPPPERTSPVLPPDVNNQPGTFTRVPNGRVLVVVDPGHGGPDPGAIGIGGLRETEIVLPIAQQIVALLEQQGIQAVLTRTGEYDLDLEPRVAMAERMNATVFVSIHANSIDLTRTDINGLETYYYSSQRLAQTIHNSILQSVDIQDRGVRSARFYVLRRTSMPSVLVEVGFVTGRDDSVKLSNAGYRSQMAQAIARGILQYLQQNS